MYNFPSHGSFPIGFIYCVLFNLSKILIIENKKMNDATEVTISTSYNELFTYIALVFRTNVSI